MLRDVGDVCHEEHRQRRYLVGGAESSSRGHLQRPREEQADQAHLGSMASRWSWLVCSLPAAHSLTRSQLFLPPCVSPGSSDENQKPWQSFVDRSEDDGKSWVRGSYIISAGRRPHLKGLIQPTIWESQPGHVTAIRASAQAVHLLSLLFIYVFAHSLVFLLF